MSKIVANRLQSVDGTVSVDIKDLELKSPDGSLWTISIADDGTITAVKK